MPFLSISPINFRNLSNKTIDVSAKEVFFVGKNGQGKSNLLETLYYSAYGSSFRTHSDVEIVKKGEVSFSLHSIFREENGITHTTSVYFDKNLKKIEKDGKILKDRKELINTMPCVLYNHDDLDFVIGAPERRRFFIDQSLTMYDIFYVDILRRYKRILKNRNLSLKEKKFDLLDSFDIQLVKNGIEIQQKRKNAIFKFNQIFGNLYEQITGIDGLTIKYNPSWKNEDFNVPDFDEAMKIVINHREVEKLMGTTMTGPHRDRISFIRNGQPFVPTASTGQRRLLALILRTSQAVFYNQITNRKPIILMDDVLLELDPEKRKKVTELLPEYEQLFCTFLEGEPYNNYITGETKIYLLNNGEWELISN